MYQVKKTFFLLFLFISTYFFGLLGSLYLINAQVSSQSSVNSQKMILDIKTPLAKSIVNSNKITVQGHTVPFGDVFVNTIEIKADKDGNFVTRVFLDEGNNLIVIVVNDENGNYLEKELTVKLQTLAP